MGVAQMDLAVLRVSKPSAAVSHVLEMTPDEFWYSLEKLEAELNDPAKLSKYEGCSFGKIPNRKEILRSPKTSGGPGSALHENRNEV